jgi:hypothetical protein
VPGSAKRNPVNFLISSPEKDGHHLRLLWMVSASASSFNLAVITAGEKLPSLPIK